MAGLEQLGFNRDGTVKIWKTPPLEQRTCPARRLSVNEGINPFFAYPREGSIQEFWLRALPQWELSAIIGVDQSTLSAWEHGRRVLNVLVGARLAKALGVTVEQLVAGLDEEEAIDRATQQAIAPYRELSAKRGLSPIRPPFQALVQAQGGDDAEEDGSDDASEGERAEVVDKRSHGGQEDNQKYREEPTKER
jgi:transcriptional regulator with XRE-family HTH domain